MRRGHTGRIMGIHRIRRLVYKMGFRPKYPSIFYSPTLHFFYAWNDGAPSATIVKEMEDAMRKVNDILKKLE